MQELLLSICIPTCKRETIVDELIQSILRQNVDPSMFEICISDNSDTDETKKLIAEKYRDVPNLRYSKTDCKGFLNSVAALRLGKGRYLKLHNDYSIFNDNALAQMIDEIRAAEAEGSYIFFSF